MQKIYFFSLAFLLIVLTVSAQRDGDNSWKTIYRATPTKINDLVHTKLDVRFDYDKSYLYGKAWITLHPHFYDTDSLTLDAKGMEIDEVALIAEDKKQSLQYRYDSLKLRIKLDRTYHKDEKYTIYISYISKPNEMKSHGSMAITDDKGLYFINPKGTDKEKPVQIWTQGETEATSVWCPIIDKPNQKTTEEIYMTVPDKYVTLSNGLLISQKKNSDGTRTDYWKMDLPHSPYLFFMGVGDYAIVKDSYKGKEVSYYVEKDYESVARKIFGNTPEMIDFFSKKLNYEYPWQKYAQITGRNYVSGAMENTTATLHTDALQQNARQLTDGNRFEDYVSHELFHQWFGDLVTAESWSNLTVNESFADYSEYLWREYKYGKDDADKANYQALQSYLFSDSQEKDLVRFHYRDKEDMFDNVSYQKGGRILHMLRNYLGDDAFFAGLNLYLKTHQFGNAEAQDLRLALEQISGKDLNWFFNQWYYGSGNPYLDISYKYDAEKQTAQAIIKQTQSNNKLFSFPVAIDVYSGGPKSRYTVWIKSKADTFNFSSATKPDLINVDADKILVAFKDDHKTLDEYIYGYKYAATYVDRREAVEYCLQHFDNPKASELIFAALDDKYSDIRNIALKGLVASKISEVFLQKVDSLATNDEYRPNRAAAIDVLGALRNKQYEPFFLKNVHDSSYSVAGASLKALSMLNIQKAVSLLPELMKDMKDNLADAVENVSVLTKTDKDFDEQLSRFNTSNFIDKMTNCVLFVTYLANVEDTGLFKKGIDEVASFKKVAAPYASNFEEDLKNAVSYVQTKKEHEMVSASNASDIKKQLKYMKDKLKFN
ncbi:M1 family metallopeptidase [Danxiaibacter flavus]|uniref:Aminopeptidase N n=1 Tax=Danxiaibacter flavus TaxID=3049108 RepID=A0ABV3ZL51_9BACT|nr:M1 family metallopeptidase [Chitinophagaceae bacterium DXS]